jgi:hypothetical protein
MTTLKISFLVGLICLCVGAEIGHKLTKPSPPVLAKVSDVQKNIKKKVTKKPDGTIVTETDTSIDQHSSVSPFIKPDNVLLEATNKLSPSLMIRPLEHLWIGAEYNIKDKEIIYKVGYSTRIF